MNLDLVHVRPRIQLIHIHQQAVRRYSHRDARQNGPTSPGPHVSYKSMLGTPWETHAEMWETIGSSINPFIGNQFNVVGFSITKKLIGYCYFTYVISSYIPIR
jgi:hypothetical protein